MGNVAPVTSAEFDKEVLQAEVPVLVDFWAEWCRPCKMVAPELEAVATQLGEKVRIRKVDVDSERELASKFGIQGIPALFIFKGGKVVDQITGYTPRQEIAERLSKQL
jgi:thioredoxin 1